VVSVRDPDELLWFRGERDRGFDSMHGTKLVLVAADEELWLWAMAEKGVVVAAAFSVDGKTEGDEADDARVAAAGVEANVRAERESGEEDWTVQLAIKPVERGADVVLFSAAVVVDAFAEFGSAKVEAEDGEAEGLESLHGVIHDFVVHGATAERMRMTDESGVRRVGRACVEESFETARGAAEIVDGAENCGADVSARHSLSLYESGSAERVGYSGASL